MDALWNANINDTYEVTRRISGVDPTAMEIVELDEPTCVEDSENNGISTTCFYLPLKCMFIV